jgi:hypothetical protein
MIIWEERVPQKRQLASATSSRPLIKKHRPDSNKARFTSSSSSTNMPFATCTTKKYTRVFPNWTCWLRSKPLKELVNSAWKNTDAVCNFQSFQLPTINKPLTLTNYEKAFRQEHNLCVRCGNHSDSDDKQCELHPLYEDIKINDKFIFGQDIRHTKRVLTRSIYKQGAIKEDSTVDATYVSNEHVWRIARKRLTEATKKHAAT